MSAHGAMNERLLRAAGRLPTRDDDQADELTQVARRLGCVDAGGLRQIVPELEGLSGAALRSATIAALRQRPYFVAGDSAGLEVAIRATGSGSADQGARDGLPLAPPSLTEQILDGVDWARRR